MKKEILDVNDITHLVTQFYTKVIDDSTIGYIFKSLKGFSFETHIPIIVSFWETVLLGNISYKDNAMLKHIELHKSSPLESKHFESWLALWEQTVHENFEGKIANDAIAKAKNIGGVMQLKIMKTNNLNLM